MEMGWEGKGIQDKGGEWERDGGDGREGEA